MSNELSSEMISAKLKNGLNKAVKKSYRVVESSRDNLEDFKPVTPFTRRKETILGMIDAREWYWKNVNGCIVDWMDKEHTMFEVTAHTRTGAVIVARCHVEEIEIA